MDLIIPEKRSEVAFYRIKSENKEWLMARAYEESVRYGREVAVAILLDTYLDELRDQYPADLVRYRVHKNRAKKAKGKN